MPRSHWVKIDNALNHIDALDDSIKRWLDDKPYSVVEETEEDPNIANLFRGALVFHVSRPYPAEWSALIGDAVHNLRSSLDHLALALSIKGYAEANKGAGLPPRDVKKSEFPVIGNVDSEGNPADGAKQFLAKKIQRKIEHVPDAAKTVIDDVQPYKRGDEFETDPIWLIHNLDIIDKHRELVLAAGRTSKLDVTNFRLSVSFDFGLGNMGALDDGDELAYWVIPRDAKVEHNLDFTFDVAFGKGTPTPGRPVVETLREFRDFLRTGPATRLDALL